MIVVDDDGGGYENEEVDPGKYREKRIFAGCLLGFQTSMVCCLAGVHSRVEGWTTVTEW